MQLSARALTELKEILRKKRGEDFVRALTEEDLNHIGLFYLEIMVQSLKLKAKKTLLVQNTTYGSRWCSESVMTQAGRQGWRISQPSSISL